MYQKDMDITVKFEYSPTDYICDNNGQNII